MPEAAVPAEGVKVGVSSGADGRRRVSVCAGTACVFAGSLKIHDAFVAEIAEAGLQDQVEVSIIGCHGLCSQGPLAVVSDGDTYYPRLKIKDVKTVVEDHLAGGQVVEKLLYVDPATGERIACSHDIPFYKAQDRIALRDVGVINPESLDEYLARGGYEAARKALTTMTPEAIIEELLASGLRGRGGAGFPTGMKWKFAAASPGDVKYIICNGDEGDPGAFMDASIMDGDPHAVLEGMLIGSYAIGAHEGYIYVRAEYPLAVKRLRMAIAAAEERGLLGDDALGSGWRLPPQDQGRRRRLRLRRGDGADRLHRGQARHAAHAAAVPRGQRPLGQAHQHQQRRDLGQRALDRRQRGGRLRRLRQRDVQGHQGLQPRRQDRQRRPRRGAHGLHAAPRHLRRRRRHQGRQAVQGGAARRPVRRLRARRACSTRRSTTRASPRPAPSSAPAAWSSPTTPPAWSTSPGTSCSSRRTRAAASASPAASAPSACSRSSTRITEGNGEEGDIERLESMAVNIKKTSLCGLGQTAPNPVLTTIRYFRDEYQAHIDERRCPALSCEALIAYVVDPDACTGCTLCAKKCPVDAATGTKKEPHTIDQALCIRCDACRAACKFDAVKVVSGPEEIAAAVRAQHT